MDASRSHLTNRVVWIVVVVLVLGLALAIGVLLESQSANQAATVESSPVAGVDTAVTGEIAPDKVEGYDYSSDGTAREEAAAGAAASPSADGPMVIRNASLEMRVDAVEDALKDVRTIAARYDAQLTDLYLYGGADDPVRPLTEGSDAAMPSPATATLTLRVAAESLDELIADISEIGVVVTQTASASDVTEQYIDLAARMKNLKAEEARLRSFFNEAEKVTELLAVQSELSRVRVEIEALQAQIDYLERQVAMATLTVALSETGPLVRPESGDWGFVEAITRGIQAAATVLTTLITGIIALAPLLVLAGVAYFVIRLVRRRRHQTEPETPLSPGDSEASAPTVAEDE